jgi:hypothetical protein
MNLADLHKELQHLQTRSNVLEAELEWFKKIFKSLVGVSGPWLSPAKAGALLGVSRDRIMDEINLAEQMRASAKRWDVVYGTHYRTIQGLDSEAPTWQINVQAFEQILNCPPDQRAMGLGDRKAG